MLAPLVGAAPLFSADAHPLRAPCVGSLGRVTRVALLGGGKMGGALVGGLLDADFDAADLAVAEVDAERRRELEGRFPDVRVVPSAAWAVADADVVVVCLKPGDVADALDAAGAALGADALVLSIAAGRHDRRARSRGSRTSGRPRDAEHAGDRSGSARPRSPPVRTPTTATSTWPRRCSARSALVVRLPEHLLDAVTGLSGSGPAYVFLVAEALVEAGVLVGLPRDVASRLVNQTLLGAATLLAQGDEGPEALRAAVTSPGGTTAAGLRSLEAAGVRSAFIDAVVAATRRSGELGGRPATDV